MKIMSINLTTVLRVVCYVLICAGIYKETGTATVLGFALVFAIFEVVFAWISALCGTVDNHFRNLTVLLKTIK